MLVKCFFIIFSFITKNRSFSFCFIPIFSFEVEFKLQVEGSVVVDKIMRARKKGYGFDAYNEKYVDMLEVGIVDPTKVTRSALQNAASIASTVLTTEAVVADKKEETPAPAMPAGGGMGGMY